MILSMDLIKEAIAVGVVLVIVGTTVGFAINKSPLSIDLPKVCNTWNDFYVMEISIFLTGVITHLLFEAIGGNKWYCKHGNACK